MCMDTHTHSWSVNVYGNASQNVCLLFFSAIVAKIKSVSSPANRSVFKSDIAKGIW